MKSGIMQAMSELPDATGIAFGSNQEFRYGWCVEHTSSDGEVNEATIFFHKLGSAAVYALNFFRSEDVLETVPRYDKDEGVIHVHRIDPWAVLDILKRPSESISELAVEADLPAEF